VAVVNGREIRNEEEIQTQKHPAKAPSNTIQQWISAFILPFGKMS